MIETKVERKDQITPPIYPCLKIREFDGCVVYFISIGRGLCLKDGAPDHPLTGSFGEWDELQFDFFTGQLTLIQK